MLLPKLRQSEISKITMSTVRVCDGDGHLYPVTDDGLDFAEVNEMRPSLSSLSTAP